MKSPLPWLVAAATPTLIAALTIDIDHLGGNASSPLQYGIFFEVYPTRQSLHPLAPLLPTHADHPSSKSTTAATAASTPSSSATVPFSSAPPSAMPPPTPGPQSTPPPCPSTPKTPSPLPCPFPSMSPEAPPPATSVSQIQAGMVRHVALLPPSAPHCDNHHPLDTATTTLNRETNRHRRAPSTLHGLLLHLRPLLGRLSNLPPLRPQRRRLRLHQPALRIRRRHVDSAQLHPDPSRSRPKLKQLLLHLL